MGEFRGGTTRVLITTDVWARGLDVQQARRLLVNQNLRCSRAAHARAAAAGMSGGGREGACSNAR